MGAERGPVTKPDSTDQIMSREAGMTAKREGMRISEALASKLASIVIHAEELFEPLGHGFDKIALQQAIAEPEVQAWIKELGPLAPVKRRVSR